jgi:acyl-coenzyme A thioesterase PaaI-like protein
LSEQPAFQDLIPGNHCWGCGPENEHGLHLKSRWGDDGAVAVWTPKPWHAAGPTHVLNGGIIATILDCHCVCTAIADAYRREGRGMETPPLIWYVTAQLDVTYLRPTPIEGPVTLRAIVTEAGRRKSLVSCTLTAGGEECARAQAVAVSVADTWHQPIS